MNRLVSSALTSLALILLAPGAMPALADTVPTPDPQAPGRTAAVLGGLAFVVVVSGLSAVLLERILRPRQPPQPPADPGQSADAREPGPGGTAP